MSRFIAAVGLLLAFISAAAAQPYPTPIFQSVQIGGSGTNSVTVAPGATAGTAATLTLGGTAGLALPVVMLPSWTTSGRPPTTTGTLGVNTTTGFPEIALGGAFHQVITDQGGQTIPSLTLSGSGTALTVTNNATVSGTILFGAAGATLNAFAQDTIAGLGAGASITSDSGAGITAFGWNALHSVTATTNEDTAFGWNSQALNTGAFNTSMGTNSLGANTTGLSNTAIGEDSMRNTVTANTSVAVGANSIRNGSGADNVGVGAFALDGNEAGGTTAFQNVAVGYGAMWGAAMTSASADVAVGWKAAFSMTSGANVTAVGYYAGALATSLANSVLVGANAGTALTTQYEETFVGSNSGNATTGVQNTFLGYQAGSGTTSGLGNVLIGDAEIAGSSGQVTTGSQNISIGYNSQVQSPTASGQLDIGNGIWGQGFTGYGVTQSVVQVGINALPNSGYGLTVGAGTTGTLLLPGLAVDTTGNITITTPATGTAASYACFTSAGKLISSATAC